MKIYPTRLHRQFLFFIFISVTILLSCNKDSDLLNDALFNEASKSIEDRQQKEEEKVEPEEVLQTEEVEEPAPVEVESDSTLIVDLESRTTAFPPLHDAHLQSGKGYNQHIIRLEEGHRTSYLMFDLSQIDSIGGQITAAELQFTINSDDGNGKVNVYKGESNDWTESNLATTAPSIGVPLGSVSKEYKIGTTEKIELNADKLSPEAATLILDHEDGNDLAFASKEHPTEEGPKLVVSYDAPIGSEIISTEEVVVAEEENPAEEETPTEEEVPVEEENPVAEGENEAPMAVADATPETGKVPLEVAFKGNASTDDGEVKSYAWDFKDGSTASTANPTHTFDETGSYEVSLTVTDAEGLTDTDTVTITVNDEENAAPVAVATATPSSGVAPLEVQFKGSDSSDDNSISSYSWDFKDGSTATNANPSHSFAEAGTYEVQLTVKDENGLSDTETVTITVTEQQQNEAPVAKITATPITGDAPLEVFFKGTDSTDDNGIVSYFWDFKDGGTGTNTTPSHDFNQAGIYEVELTVTDAQGLSDTDTVTITVNEPSGGNNGGNNGSYPSNAVMASSFGYNSSDATNALRNALESSNSFIVVDRQSSDWVIQPLSLSDIRNKTIVFEDGVVLRAKSGAYPESKRMLQFVNGDNIEILGYGATFKMNKGTYSGQQNHALSLINSKNITIKGLVLRDSGGDGIYISRYNGGQYCQNIRIEDITATNNDRQGMTVVSVDGLIVKNSTFSDTRGESPGAGVDFEPEDIRDRLRNIVMENCDFKNNYGPGIMFALSKTKSSSPSMSATFKNVTLSNNSNDGVYDTEIYLGKSTNNKFDPINGSITFDGLRVENSKWSAIWTKRTLESYSVTVKNAVIKNVSTGSNSSVIHIGLLDYGNTSNANMGGFTFQNVLIDYDGNDPSLELHGPSDGNWHLRNMSGEIRVRSPRGTQLKDNLNKLSNSGSSVTLRVVED